MARWLSWSGGKDSALALWALRGGDVGRGPGEPAPVSALLTTVTRDYGRVSMHGVRRGLARAQAAAAGLPLVELEIPAGCTDAEYEARMAAVLTAAAGGGLTAVAFGDLFLQDIRSFRERQLARLGLRAEFPLWGLDTGELARRFLALGFKAWVVCVDTQRLDGSFAGRPFDEAFLADLPPGVDPCGEHGEFHTFVYDGPVFRRPVAVRRGPVVLRDRRFAYCDLLPAFGGTSGRARGAQG